MKKLFALVLLPFVLSACSTRIWHSDKVRDVASYIRKVERKPDSKKYAERLKIAYQEQKDRVLQDIENLRKQKNPFYWEAVHEKYSILNEMASGINNCHACQAIQTPVFYRSEQRDALNKATSERIEAGLLALGLNSKPEAQKAYYNFLKARKLSPGRKEIDSLINESLEEGQVLIVLEGDYRNDKDYVADIEKSLLITLQKSIEAKPFFRFYNPETAKESHLRPDYVIRFGYEYLNAGFEQRNCTEESFSVDIKIGEKKIDSVKVEPVYEKVTAKVARCKKSVSAEGKVWIEIVDYQSERNILRDTYYDTDNWVNEWVSVSGDSRALPGGVTNSGSENFPPTRWMQFDKITTGLTNSLSWKIRTFIRNQNAFAFR